MNTPTPTASVASPQLAPTAMNATAHVLVQSDAPTTATTTSGKDHVRFATNLPRVKCVDAHPSEPWVLTAGFGGEVLVWDYAAKTIVRRFRVAPADVPVRAARFIARERWIVAASDDHRLHVLDLPTGAILRSFLAHDDYIRCLDVHPTRSLLVSSADDKVAKIWDWSHDWSCTRVLRGHEHYVMAVVFAPTEGNGVESDGLVLATASLDHTARIWTVKASDRGDQDSVRVLEGHRDGLNTVVFDGPHHLITGSDDHELRVWDLSASTTSSTALIGHTNNVTTVITIAHPTRALVLSGAEDGTIRLWDASTQRCVGVWSHGRGRCWSLRALPMHSTQVAIGDDQGAMLFDVDGAAAGVVTKAKL